MLTFISDITGNGAVVPQTAVPASGALNGQVWIVTGGHGGIGLATTKGLAQGGAKVYIASRTATKVEEAIKALVEEQPALSPLLHHLQLDLASLKSCDAAATTFKTKETRLDGIVANAGIMAVPYELTEDGVETQFQTNHLGHWLFALKLHDLMAKTGEARGSPARLVNLSSFAHNFITVYPFAKPEFDSLTKVNRSFDPLGYIRYSQAKLSAILFSREWNKRSSPHVRSLSVHPGFVASALYASQPIMKPLLGLFIGIQEGALSSLYAATSPEVETKNLWGSYLVPFAKVKQTTAYGDDEKLASELWNLGEALCDKFL